MSLGRWVTIDGVEGTGKTTLVEALSKHIDVSVAPEFSDASFGATLKRAVIETPHFISVSPIGQSLVFLGDYFELYESYVSPGIERGEVIVSDRGPLSKLIYQTVVLEETLGSEGARKLVESILELLPPPNLTVYLECPVDVIESRLRTRDGSCSDSRIDFIRRCDALAQTRISEGGLATHVVRVDCAQPTELTVAAVAGLVQDL